MSSGITKEQQQRIEENRRKALEKKATRLAKPAASFYPHSSGASQPITSTAAKKADSCLAKLAASFCPHSSVVSQPITSTAAKIADSYNGSDPYKRFKPSHMNSSSDLKPFSGAQQLSNIFNLKVVTGYCRLITTDRFLVDVGYHQLLINTFKSIKSGSYDASEKKWSFHIDDHGKLMSLLHELKGEVSISGLPGYILETFSKPLPPPDDIDLSRIDSRLLVDLMPFQKEGVCFGIGKRGRCLIADDMGLGKTIQALGIAHYYHEDWPLLVVCPSSMKMQWAESIQTWLPSVPLHHITIMMSGKDHVSDARVVIVSYDLLSRHFSSLPMPKFGVVILDESHFLKSWNSTRTQTVSAVVKRCRRVLLLSGTPALSRPNELYTQLQMIDRKVFQSFQEFGLRYCAGKKNHWGWDYSGSSNMEELQLLLENRFMIRRLKAKVITQLPAKRRQVVILNPSRISSKTKEMKRNMEMLESGTLKGIERRGALLTYFSSTGTAKLPAIKDYIADLLEGDKKFICFVHHSIVMKGVCETIEQKKCSYIKIAGSTTPVHRKELCDQFQFQDNCMVAVLSITAANTGITLTAAQLVVFAELFWNPGILTQAEDRAHRIGQQDSVLVQYLVAQGTADDHLWPLIQSKLDVLNKAGLSKDNFLNSDTTHSRNTGATTQKTLKNYFDVLINEDSDEFLASALDETEAKLGICVDRNDLC